MPEHIAQPWLHAAATRIMFKTFEGNDGHINTQGVEMLLEKKR